MKLLTREQVREVDRLAIEELGIPGVVLMENAGRNAAHAALDHLEQEMQICAEDADVAVLCGGGNNGGDGYVIARHLHNAGVRAVAYACTPGDALTGDAAINWAIAEAMGIVELAESEAALTLIDEQNPHLVVDALLGTGSTGAPRGHIVLAIQACNRAKHKGAHVVAVDVPSGLDCDTGEAAGEAVLADLTVTFVAPKVGFNAAGAAKYLGTLTVVDIGAPPELVGRVLRPTE